MKASSVRDARPAICRPCIPEAVEGGSIPGHNYLELRFTSNSTQLWPGMYPPLQRPSCATHIHDRPRISDASSFHPLLYYMDLHITTCPACSPRRSHADSVADRTRIRLGQPTPPVYLVAPRAGYTLHFRVQFFSFSITHPFQSLQSYHLWYYMFY